MRLSDRYIELMQMDKEEVANIVTDLEGTLDEIEEIAKNGVKDDCDMPLDELSIILQLIKQVKEGD